MCQSKSGNGQQNESSHNWEEEAIRQNQLYPDLSEFLNAFLASANTNSAANASEAPQPEEDRRQSVLQNILAVLANNFSPESSNNHGSQEVPKSSSNPDPNMDNSQHQRKKDDESNSRPENNSEPSLNRGRSAPSAPTQEPSHDNPHHFGCPHSSGEADMFGFNTAFGSRRRPQGMPWSYQHQRCYNMNDRMDHTRTNWNNRPHSSIINPELAYLFSTFLFGCMKASLFVAFLVTLFGALCLLPHTLMAIGLAIAVIRSITRIPILPLIAGSAFIATLLYIDSHFLMLLCGYAIFKSVVMGRPLVNRHFWRRCCQMD